eukprot:11224392-Lingulodinium_polyedra.AAC.1
MPRLLVSCGFATSASNAGKRRIAPGSVKIVPRALEELLLEDFLQSKVYLALASLPARHT